MLFRSLITPAIGSEEDNLITRARNWTERQRRQRLRRQAFATLLHVDDNILEDVSGLTRAQVEHLARLPLHLDAVEEARGIRRRSS